MQNAQVRRRGATCQAPSECAEWVGCSPKGRTTFAESVVSTPGQHGTRYTRPAPAVSLQTGSYLLGQR